MLNYFYRYLKKYCSSGKLIFVLIIVAIILACSTYYVISIESKSLGPDPSRVIGLILVDLAVFLLLGILLARKFLRDFIDKGERETSSKLQNRIIIAFSLIATIPTIIVSVFSAYFFNFGIQSWFDKKISAVLDQSIIVAESYIDEHKLQLRETALSVADDLTEMYYNLIHNPLSFNEALNTEVEMRSLDEAIVFHRPTNTVIANTFLSFAISFATIPAHLMKRAELGEIVEIKSDPKKIRMLTKLKDHNDIYLLVGRLIDAKIIDHIDKTNGAAEEYYRLKKHISSMQIKFSIVFIFIALLLLLAAISWGMIFATKIVKPIRKLVIATEKVKNGDLTIQVPEDLVNKDEISVLSSAFNRMIKQIDHQQRDLVIAQRALAWSDVARKVAHEIKNPLTPIHLASERLLRKFSNQVEDKTEFNKYIQMIVRHTDDIKKIVSEFVNFARLPAPIFMDCDLVILIKNMVESRKLINDKILYKFITTDQHIDFICDTTQINQIMVNLLKNAEESIGLTRFQQGVIAVSITKSNHQITITVNDNGVGFQANLIDRATEAYITTRSKGTGLGLAIIKKIAQDHCATLELANKYEGGAIVNITFNLDELKLKINNSKSINHIFT
ncbi:PAS domain-containing sensor histidine kinase [Candidatus Tisiphia endosymbiont of Dascillus cervinus]|uniref:sensor histidine kinase NtrY-like n=1 Tax=Candidatus Tisiphia endosymbiont of Dascillus cervinus TaxID=3066253 RepID=UPI00312C9BB2|nr:PAS domain-containing sensor histidine kinase [Rickettsiaceae bacterium]MDD9337044.1 PAS domain-containing sensor histidine kinase [Rickettsiaceae bacterium]